MAATHRRNHPVEGEGSGAANPKERQYGDGTRRRTSGAKLRRWWCLPTMCMKREALSDGGALTQPWCKLILCACERLCLCLWSRQKEAVLMRWLSPAPSILNGIILTTRFGANKEEEKRKLSLRYKGANAFCSGDSTKENRRSAEKKTKREVKIIRAVQ